MGLAPVVKTSLTQWFTTSMPTVSKRSMRVASFSFVPGESVLETRTG